MMPFVYELIRVRVQVNISGVYSMLYTL